MNSECLYCGNKTPHRRRKYCRDRCEQQFKRMDKKQFNKKRPLSWSAISSFEYDKEQWYKKYILGEPTPETKEMIFGKIFANSCENRKPLVPTPLCKEVEYPLNVMFGEIPLIGFIDTYEPHTMLREKKTGKKEWDQKRADEHGQITMYLLQLYIMHKVKPEDIRCFLDWHPTQENGDFTISFVEPHKLHTFETKRTMVQVLEFGARINRVFKEMDDYAKERLALA